MHQSIRRTFVGYAALLSLPTAFAVSIPEVTNVTMTQPENSREVTIEYTLANGPAVITVDIQTNAHDDVWVSIGGENLTHFTADSEVWKKVEGNAKHVIRWRPDRHWCGNKVGPGGARALVKAWALNNTPDYMVVDIASGAQPNTQRYYPTEDCLPGGILANTAYRMDKIVMRKITAANAQWMMGSLTESGRRNDYETAHEAVLSNNYYIGVFEVTQRQYELIEQKAINLWNYYRPAYFNNGSDYAMRPVENVGQDKIRAYSDGKNGWYPNPPGPTDSYLGKLREVTGIDFDLPTDAQWEFACRAGNGEGKWGDGSDYTDATTDPNLKARYQNNGGYAGGAEPAQDCTAEHGTAICGTNEKNAWGLYDMHGNVAEWCLDWFSYDVSSLRGAVNVSDTNPDYNRFNESIGTGTRYRIIRGGAWNSVASGCRSAYRAFSGNDTKSSAIGFRLCCRAGLD